MTDPASALPTELPAPRRQRDANRVNGWRTSVFQYCPWLPLRLPWGKRKGTRRVSVLSARAKLGPAASLQAKTSNSTEVYGEWPYPSSPPVYMPPPPAYYPPGYALGAGLAFAAGVAVVGRL
jgi:hypothetical protein